MKTRTLIGTTVLALAVACSAGANEDTQGPSGGHRGKQAKKMAIHKNKQQAENQKFRKSLKNIDKDERVDEIVDHREEQYGENKQFIDKLHSARIKHLEARLKKVKRLTDAQKADILSFFETQYGENVAFRDDRHGAIVDYIVKIAGNEDMTHEEKKAALKKFAGEQKAATEQHRESQKEETKAKVQGLKGKAKAE